MLSLTSKLRLVVPNICGHDSRMALDLVDSVPTVQTICKGEGGYAEDNEYFGELANI